ncbi:MAG TPA: alpha-hydroxy acid oxidase [Pseudonocardiaceae bacterium]|nr:alpha-hydroxy acid oxidase [Pseudonocardiaceae bacterium]
MLDGIVNVADFERLMAESDVPDKVRDFFNGGAEDEVTLRANTERIADLRLVPHVLSGVGSPDLSVTVLGRRVEMPIFVSPTGHRDFLVADADAELCRGTADAGAIGSIAWRAGAALDDVGPAKADDTRWYQVYPANDFALLHRRIGEAAELGYHAVLVTVDVPVVGARERDIRAGFTEAQRNALKGVSATEADTSVDWSRVGPIPATWDQVGELVARSPLPIIVKGILHPADARRAVDVGARGVLVSNHGGRQLDSAIATIDALPGVVAAVAGNLEVFVDGGFRRGTDILKALALGAKAVGVGRPALWALRAGGAEGVTRLCGTLRAELARALALCGQAGAADVDRDILLGAP